MADLNYKIEFDWSKRIEKYKQWKPASVSSDGKNISRSYYSRIQEMTDNIYPVPFENKLIELSNKTNIFKNGYDIDNNIISKGICDDLISTFIEFRQPLDSNLLNKIKEYRVIDNCIKSIFNKTGIKHLIWTCFFSKKDNTTTALNDIWHYDNHYNSWTPKLIIYLNDQQSNLGSTHLCEHKTSLAISSTSDYIGLVSQRKMFRQYMEPIKDILKLDPVSMDPKYYSFSANASGEGVYFYPSRVLHRGVSPKKGIRFTMSMSFTPIPNDTDLSFEQLSETSYRILSSNINSSMVLADYNPYWFNY